MRLKIRFKVNNLQLPFNYREYIQAAILKSLNAETSSFYHNEGYECDNKVYKLFTFSRLQGEYSVEDFKLVFKDVVSLFIASVDTNLLKELYQKLISTGIMQIRESFVSVESVDIIDDIYFRGLKENAIYTISPVVVNKKIGEKTFYYSPDQEDFRELLLNNLKRKCQLNYAEMDINDITFKNIKEIHLKYKDHFAIGYNFQMSFISNSDTFNVIMNCGLGINNSTGLGMMEEVYEEKHLCV